MEPIAQLWSTTRFRARELSAYAERLMVEETRRGVITMSAVLLALLLGSLLLGELVHLERTELVTCAALAVLALHVGFSARAIDEIGGLHALGIALLVVSGASFVLLAHQAGAFGVALFSSVVLLFMAIPLVPWGLREASTVTLLIYALFATSTRSVSGRFDPETLSRLHLFMLAASVVSLTLVARSTRVRRADIRARFELERAQREAQRLSYQDPLTTAWNRRFLAAEFQGFVEGSRKSPAAAFFALLDIDHFKRLNDTRGHVYADRVLQWVGAAFRTALGERGHLVRTGGDEFVLLFEGDEPEELIESAVSAVEASAAGEGGGALGISLSVGLVELPAAGQVTLDGIYRAADSALYRAKRAGGGGAGSIRLARGELASGREENADAGGHG